MHYQSSASVLFYCFLCFCDSKREFLLQMLARFSAMTTPLSVGLPPLLRAPILSSKLSLLSPVVRCRFKRTFRSIYTDNGAPVVVAEDGKYGRKEVISLTPQLYDYVLSNVREPQVIFLVFLLSKSFGFLTYFRG